MALSLGDINKKNPSRKPKKSNKARGKTLMPWQIPDDRMVAKNNTQTTHINAEDIAAKETTHKNHTQTAHKKNNKDTQTTHKQHTGKPVESKATTHKPNTNHTQNSGSLKSKPFESSNYTQTTHKPHTEKQAEIRETTHKTTHEPHTSNNHPLTAHKPQTPLHTNGSQLQTNTTQTTNKLVTNSTPYPTQKLHTDELQNHTQALGEIETKLRKLSGLKLQLFEFIYNHCIQNVTNELVITYEALSHFSGVKPGSIKEITRRLDNKEGLISRVSPKGGRGTHTVFSIAPDTVAAFTRIKQNRPLTTETTHNYSTKPHTNAGETPYKPHTAQHTESSSKEMYLKKSFLPSSFKISEIDLSDVSSFGISEKHLQDMINQRLELTTEQVQSLVDKFALFMQRPENLSGVKRPPGLFVRFGQRLALGEDVLPDVETDEDRLLREYIERRKQVQNERKSALNELFELEFGYWREELSREALLELVPEEKFKLYDGAAWNADLRNYFEKNVWPGKKPNLTR